jgi:hypothetical protein
VGCGTYCQQAGLSAGSGPHGYPCPAAGCGQCPPQGCLTLQSSAATATNGVATVRLRCNLSIACRGAFLICLPGDFCESGQTYSQFGGGGRLAGSDFVVPAGTTANVGVGLTDLGKQLAPEQGGVIGGVLVDLSGYGLLGATTAYSKGEGDFTLTSTDPPSYPAGATASCGGVVFVGPDTSCPFAKNVEKAYSHANKSSIWNATVRAFSPVTGRTYLMHCVGFSPHVCRGGTNALVEFYF